MRNDLDVVLITKTKRDQKFPKIALNEVVAELEKYGDLLQPAEEATLFRTGTKDWRLQHLTTRTGEVLGTSECYNRTIERVRLTQEAARSSAKDGKVD